MPMQNITLDDLFTPAALTTAIQTLPATPTKLGQSGLFEDDFTNTNFVVIDEEEGRLVLVKNMSRDGDAPRKGNDKRKRRVFEAPHLPKSATVLPTELNVVGFGQTTAIDAQAKVVNRKLQGLKNDIEATKEYHRVGAISGKIYDSDGTTVIYDLYNEFGVTEKNININFASDTTDIRKLLIDGKRHAEKALGVALVEDWVCYCSASFFDKLVAHPMVKEAYANWQMAQEALGKDTRKGFSHADITFIEYEVTVTGTNGSEVRYITDGTARLVPVVKGLFKVIYTPANYNETVGTLGEPIYAKAEARPMGKGWDVEAQSNPLIICSVPKALVKFTATTS